MAGFLVKTPTPNEIRTIFKLYHSGQYQFDDWRLDELLGIESIRLERNVTEETLRERHGEEQFKYEGTPYSFIRDFLHFVKPQKSDAVYDLGSGYGRIVFYGALTARSTFKGIEVVSERVKACEQTRAKLELNNAEFIEGNAASQDYSGGTIFFLFNPFRLDTLRQVGKQLGIIAQKRRIKIASWGGPSDRFFSQQSWLAETTPKRKVFSIFSERLHYYESK